MDHISTNFSIELLTNTFHSLKLQHQHILSAKQNNIQAYKISIYDNIIYLDEYYLFQSISRWWWAQSRQYAFDFFDEHFMNVAKFYQTINHSIEINHKSSEYMEFAETTITYLAELLDTIPYMKTIYPDYDEFNELLSNTLEVLSIVKTSIQRKISKFHVIQFNKQCKNKRKRSNHHPIHQLNDDNEFKSIPDMISQTYYHAKKTPQIEKPPPECD